MSIILEVNYQTAYTCCLLILLTVCAGPTILLDELPAEEWCNIAWLILRITNLCFFIFYFRVFLSIRRVALARLRGQFTYSWRKRRKDRYILFPIKIKWNGQFRSGFELSSSNSFVTTMTVIPHAHGIHNRALDENRNFYWTRLPNDKHDFLLNTPKYSSIH